MITPATAQEASATVETATPAAAPVPSTTDAVQAAPTPAGATGTEASATAVPTPGPRPKLVDLGAGKCIPCKKMAPIIEEAKKLYEGKADIEFIDVWENKSAGEPYGIRMIPTQIFFDATGKEVFRHEGFFPMEDIQKQFESMGVTLK
ncbi:MAG TPA: thioredoxin domain-containing protein [Candidatus Ozemobacteraceae bacterium]